MSNLDSAVSEHDDIIRRVHTQLNNINKVNPSEAFNIALAHARVLNAMLAQMADSDEGYVADATELHKIMIREGIAARDIHAKQDPCQARP
jgi:hypothetical protein